MHTADLRFHLTPRGKGEERVVYQVLYFNGVQYRASTKIKVYISQWVNKYQECYTGNNLCNLDKAHNIEVNRKLAEVKKRFSEFLDYLCQKDTITTKDILDFMANKKEKLEDMTTAQLLTKALDFFDKKSDTKESSKRQYYSTLSILCDYFKGKPEEDLSEESVKKYHEFLESSNLNTSTKRERWRVLKLLVNRIIIPEFKMTSIQPIQDYIGLGKTKKDEETKHFALTEEERAKILEEPLTTDSQRVLCLMKLQILSGLRYSDLFKLVNGEYKEENDFAVIRTTKTNEEAFVRLSEFVLFCIEYLKGGKEISLSYYNKEIKEVAKRLNLTRIVERTNKRVCDCISSHDFRFTFATHCLRVGESKDDVAQKLGHKNTSMVDNIYEDLNREDITNKLKKSGKKETNPLNELMMDFYLSGEKDFNIFVSERGKKILESKITKGRDLYEIFPTLKTKNNKKDEQQQDYNFEDFEL